MVLPPPPSRLVTNDFTCAELVQDWSVLARPIDTRFGPDPRVMGGIDPGTPDVRRRRGAPDATPPARAASTCPAAQAPILFGGLGGYSTAPRTGAPRSEDMDEVTECRAGALGRKPAKASFATRWGGLPTTRSTSSRWRQVRRFPVLAHWSFTCTGDGIVLPTVLEGIDVGLLGTPPAEPSARPRAERAPLQKGDAPPAAPPPRPQPELTETGHVGLRHMRAGGTSTAPWYRGPLCCPSRRATRRIPTSGCRAPARSASPHVPDGREDLALAAAFEIGRLLALSQLSIVSALMRFRREQFGAERARRLAEIALEGLDVVKPPAAGDLVDSSDNSSAAASCRGGQAPEKSSHRAVPSSTPAGHYPFPRLTSINSWPMVSAFRCRRCESSRTHSEWLARSPPRSCRMRRRTASTRRRPKGSVKGSPGP